MDNAARTTSAAVTGLIEQGGHTSAAVDAVAKTADEAAAAADEAKRTAKVRVLGKQPTDPGEPPRAKLAATIPGVGQEVAQPMESEADGSEAPPSASPAEEELPDV